MCHPLFAILRTRGKVGCRQENSTTTAVSPACASLRVSRRYEQPQKKKSSSKLRQRGVLNARRCPLELHAPRVTYTPSTGRPLSAVYVPRRLLVEVYRVLLYFEQTRYRYGWARSQSLRTANSCGTHLSLLLCSSSARLGLPPICLDPASNPIVYRVYLHRMPHRFASPSLSLSLHPDQNGNPC